MCGSQGRTSTLARTRSVLAHEIVSGLVNRGATIVRPPEEAGSRSGVRVRGAVSGAVAGDADHAACAGDGPLLVGEFVVGEGSLGLGAFQFPGGGGRVDL